MATIAIHPASRTRLRITERGRRVLSVLVALPVAAVVGVAALSGGSALASRDEGVAAGAFTEVTVMSGETLWSIAEEIAPAADPRDVVDDIVRLNALENVVVTAGQRLALPMEYSAVE